MVLALLVGLNSKVVNAQLVSHNPILIDPTKSGAPWTAYGNGVMRGSGTSTDPYLIEGWDIDTSSDNGIEIRNSNFFFIIRNVYVHLKNLGTCFDVCPNGIVFSSVTNGRVESSTISENDDGIDISRSADITVKSSKVSANSHFGILVEDSNRIVLESDDVSENAGEGITSLRSSNVEVLTSSAAGNEIGIRLVSSSGTIRSNGVRNSQSKGILLDSSNQVTVINNLVAESWYDGIEVRSSDHLQITANNVSDNGASLTLHSSSYVSAYHNIFDNRNGRSGHSPAPYDDSAGNSWDNGYPGGGNYWSDYVGQDRCSGEGQNECTGADGFGDTPYSIQTSGQDRYPLMTPTTNPASPGGSNPGGTGPNIPPGGQQEPSRFPFYVIAAVAVVVAIGVLVLVFRRKATSQQTLEGNISGSTLRWCSPKNARNCALC